MKIERIIVGELEENCYIVSLDNECIIIDPGDEFPRLKEKIDSQKVVGCLITHFHQDHIGALEEVLGTYDVSVNKVTSPKFKFQIIETPGHTIDSKTFYFPNENIMFTGDFLFKGAYGRTDLPTGNINDMKDSLLKIFKYHLSIKIYPGHGESSTLANEYQHYV